MTLTSTFLDTLFSVLGVVVGAVATYVGLRTLRRARLTHSWQPVPAKVLRTRLVHDDGISMPEVTYRYELDGAEHESTQIRLITTGTNLRTPAQRVLDRYSVNSTVFAYVDPDNHSQAVLEPGQQDLSALVIVAVGLLCAGFGAYHIAVGLALIR